MKGQQTLQERLATREVIVGLLQTHAHPAITELAGMCGYDFVLLDAEHGVFSESDFVLALQVLASTGTLGMVRLAGHDTHALGRYMDMGAAAIVVPNVSTAEEARAMVRAMQYPPTGSRGLGAAAHRGTRYGLDFAAHLSAPRGGVGLFVLIESSLGVANAADILDVEGVDGAIIGPADLSASLGRAGDYAQPAYAQALARVESAAAARNKLLGSVPHAGHSLQALQARGYRLLILGADMSLIREAMRAQILKARPD